MDEQVLQRYEPEVGRISRLYYGLYVRGRQQYDVDLGDFEQVGRMAVFNVSKKRPEKLDCLPYVRAAIKNAVRNEMRKTRHKVRSIYLIKEYEEQVPIVDVIPTNEKSNKMDDLEELLYHIKHEFSQKDAEVLEALLERCDNIYDLNLSEPPSTDTKDRVKVVTKMDLNDEEMAVYAEVLLGVKARFPNGYVMAYTSRNVETKQRACRYLGAVLDALEIGSSEFAGRNDKTETIGKYRLRGFLNGNYNGQVKDFIMDLDPSIKPENIFWTRKWKGEIGMSKLSDIIRRHVECMGKSPSEIKRFELMNDPTLRCMLISSSSILKDFRLAIELAYPRTYPEYIESANKLRKSLL